MSYMGSFLAIQRLRNQRNGIDEGVSVNGIRRTTDVIPIDIRDIPERRAVCSRSAVHTTVSETVRLHHQPVDSRGGN